MLPLLLAATVQTSSLEPKVVSVAMFKNGYALVLREMDVPTSGVHDLSKMPAATLGTLWFAGDSNVKLLEIVRSSVETTKKELLGSIDELLRANVGQEVTLGLTGTEAGSDKAVRGKLIHAEGAILVIQRDQGTLAIPKSNVASVASAGTLVTERSSKVNTDALRIRTGGRGKLTMVSFERGITWVPAYAVELIGENRLRLNAKATVINELEDLDKAQARFITGFPNVPYTAVGDPLVSPNRLDEFLQFLGRIGPSDAISFGRADNALMNQSPGGFRVAGPPPAGNAEGQAEDLFFYLQPSLSLKKNDRSYLTLFEADSTYEDLYTWDVSDSIVDGRGRPPVQTPVWHILRFRNSAKQPLTTAVATVFRDGRIVGQDMLKYTPDGATTELTLNKALDISTEIEEQEISRERNALDLRERGRADAVTIRATLQVSNLGNKRVPMRVTKRFDGEILSVSDSGKTKGVSKALSALNPSGAMEWTFPLNPGETKKLTYDVKLFIQ